MQYLTRDLYIYYQPSADDKFLIGYLNDKKNKLKDVITGEVVKCIIPCQISILKSIKNGGHDWASCFMTGLRTSKATISQKFLAKKIDLIVKKEVITADQIQVIKKIMNKEITATNEKKDEEKDCVN